MALQRQEKHSPAPLTQEESIWSSVHVDINYANSSLSGIICLCHHVFKTSVDVASKDA